jgi:hypothetical protein
VLLKDSKFKEAVDFVRCCGEENPQFSKLSDPADEVILTHAITKAMIKIGDLRALDNSCLLKINTLLNTLFSLKERATVSEEQPSSLITIDRCLA